MTDEMSPEDDESRRRASAAHLAEAGAAMFVVKFVWAWAEGRFDEARACIDPESPIHDAIGDPFAVGVAFIATDPEWGLWGVPDVLDNGDEKVTFIRGHAGHTAPDAIAGEPYVQFVVRRRGEAWCVIRMIRYEC